MKLKGVLRQHQPNVDSNDNGTVLDIHGNNNSNDNNNLALSAPATNLQYNVIREILVFIHHHFRFMLTRHGLGHHTEHRPARLSIHAILNARLMDEYKEVLLSQSLREKTWPVVESINEYRDIVPWLIENRCPYIYNAETMKAANVYGIYRHADGAGYEGDWIDGKLSGQGKYIFADGDVYEGGYVDSKKNGQGN